MLLLQLTFWPKYESLRFASALIMGVAVCGAHYTGMCAAEYEYSTENFARSSRVVISGSHASVIASHGSLLTCFWLSATAVVVSNRHQLLLKSLEG